MMRVEIENDWRMTRQQRWVLGGGSLEPLTTPNRYLTLRILRNI